MPSVKLISVDQEAEALRARDAEFAAWAEGCGAIRHRAETQLRVYDMRQALAARHVAGDGVPFFTMLKALDRVTNAAMWFVAHMTYAKHVHLDGRPLQAEDFKSNPQGHMGGSLNMVPAYAGYLAANALTGITRGWVMGQGHCVSAIDALNVLVGNMTPAHAERYGVSDAQLSRMAQDFYSYRLAPDGSPESPLGSHVNAHTAGAILEGGFLGFAELLYAHMPLPGERLTAFLSDGAFEEQRGGDWAPRWWRAQDCGMVTPILISNGRRIDQRTLAAQEGGPTWLSQHLKINGYDPVVFDGRDPAAFVWAIWAMEERLQHCIDRAHAGTLRYPAPLPYGIAVAPKGAGFHGEGTNAAHGTPLGENPHSSPTAAAHFNASAQRLWVPPAELRASIACFGAHRGRARERDNAIAHRDVAPVEIVPAWREAGPEAPAASAMQAIDDGFVAAVEAAPHLRARFGNPDESRSNHMVRTLERLKHRVTDVELADEEAVDGGVITVLNEEAVVCAALGNKGGINIAVTYEAFAVKMQSALRQEIIFAAHAKAAGHPARWLSVPVVLTSHTWENGKNELSHQDTSMAEAMFGEPSDIARVMFPVDYNSAAAVMREVYRTRGRIFTVVAAKSEMPSVFDAHDARELVADGAILVKHAGHRPGEAELAITAIGACQLQEALKASRRLRQRDVPHRVVCLLEPARFRRGRTAAEETHSSWDHCGRGLYAATSAHVLLCHTRPETMVGLLQPMLAGRTVAALGYRGRGGTLDMQGMLFANGCTWAHAVREVSGLLHIDLADLLSDDEIDAVGGISNPAEVARKTLASI
ncbi:MAG: xylulose 5-phosphate 3-epimerase [Proteobacteria bacterium]|nr:xylulose 5-phosphate 3-epimerase [Pseudomonadota bacterium]